MSLFITFEGIEGSGKSTQLGRLAELLRSGGHRVVETREPGGTPAGTALRRLLLAPDAPPLAAATEVLLYCADRAQHVHEVIRPALEAGSIVLCDRFSDSTIAYQGYGRQLDVAMVEAIDACARQGLTPALTFLLDCPVAEGLRRVSRRVAGQDRLEREPLAFHDRIRAGFHLLAGREPRRFVTIDTTAPVDEVAAQVALETEGRLAEARCGSRK